MWEIVPCRNPKQHVWYWFVFSTKRLQSSLVEQLASDPNLLPYFWKAYCQNTSKSGQELCYRLFYGYSRRFYEVRQKEQKEQKTEQKIEELCYRLFYGCSRRFYEIRQKERALVSPYNVDKTVPYRFDSDRLVTRHIYLCSSKCNSSVVIMAKCAYIIFW